MYINTPMYGICFLVNMALVLIDILLVCMCAGDIINVKINMINDIGIVLARDKSFNGYFIKQKNVIYYVSSIQSHLDGLDVKHKKKEPKKNSKAGFSSRFKVVQFFSSCWIWDLNFV